MLTTRQPSHSVYIRISYNKEVLFLWELGVHTDGQAGEEESGEMHATYLPYKMSALSCRHSRYLHTQHQQRSIHCHGPPHIGANGVSRSPWKNGRKIKKRKHARKSSFLCLCYILRAIRAGGCRERRYADHIFIQIHFRMHHFVVKFSKFSSPQAARGH